MRRNTQQGQILVLVAFGLVVLIGVMGLAVDMGYLRYVRRQIQSAADAAALSAGLELSSCGTGCTTSIKTAAEAASSENGFTNGQKGVVVTANNPPTSAGDPHASDDNYVEVIISQPEPVHFASIFGVTSSTVSARAEAKRTGSINCVYGLNTFNLVAGAVDAPNCGMVIEQNLTCAAGSITATRIGVAGSSGGLLCATTPAPIPIGLPRPPDPLAYLPAPATAPCGAGLTGPNTYTGSNGQVPATAGATFNPGVYCGGIKITTGSATFNPGTYVLTSTGATDGGLTITFPGTATGNGVTFYNHGPMGAINFVAGGVNLTAPTSGTYEGVLFFQDTNNTQQANFDISIGTTNTLAGAYYFPNANLSFLADLGQSAPYTILDALNINFTVATFTIGSDYSSLPDGSPIKGGAVLVE
jgi:Flp pilus assembly protein TadG